MTTNEWIGIPEERFSRYRRWMTPSGYLCGTYAAAVFLAYYQDYVDEKIIPANLRNKNAQTSKSLIDILHLLIQPHGLPTLPIQVGYGLSRYFDFYKLPYRARTTMLGGWHRATKRIDQGRPVILGLMRGLGSSYGNHWVVAYAYLETEDGQRFFKVHDNWGDHRKVIPAAWINGTISLPL
ncbi:MULTISPECIES: hypothetical protein [Enterococcus]|uniref:hypothetical protein n=1 Tax=Enterococcus TaxID=1350 RepID=UPI00065E2A33|nr:MULTISPECIES: hypothetical protein [Enterococcus]KAF1300596.1 hypothetical protein BAU16_12410 [Enterococcus sp. JM9B]